jgi:hypothetical protein
MVVHQTSPSYELRGNGKYPRLPGWCSHPASKVGYTLHICKLLGFRSGAVDTPVLMRYGLVSLDDWCRIYRESIIVT